MAEHRRVVFSAAADVDRLPDWAGAGVVMIEWLQQRGLWQDIAERLKIQREGGYAGIDAFLFLLYFFGSELKGGIKEFSTRARKSHVQLAAVGGCQRLPTQSSMSRILSAVEPELARGFGSWLLGEVPGLIEVLQHPSVLTRDALGQGWHVFDWDPTVTVLRHRALPVIEGTPDGRRRSKALAEPGYPGRKRGDVQFSRATLQHAGSGLWLGIEMAPGNGALREAFEAAVHQVVGVCEYAKLPRDRAILRSDGVAGNVPFITACLDDGLHYITRLAHYQLLQDEAVVRHLNETAWHEVPSSGSGPTRQATDLGWVVLEPTPPRDHADGDVIFKPVETRVVVSRYATSKQGHGAGVTLEGWHYELYGTDLSVEGWPGAEIVAGYYGRSGQENRFAQEDRELGLDRIFSYHLPGQQLATLIGLFVWNFLTCRGMDFSRPPETLPEQQIAQSIAVAQTPNLHVTQVGVDEPKQSEPDDGPVASTLSALAPLESTTNAASSNTALVSHRSDLVRLLDAADWAAILEQHEGWMWLPHERALSCRAKVSLPLKRIEKVLGGRKIRTMFEAAWGACDGCEHRETCISSEDPHYRKNVRLPIPPPHADPVFALWMSMTKSQRQSTMASNDGATQEAPRRIIWRLKPLSWRRPLSPSSGPLFAVAPPCLLPSELRKTSRHTARGLEVRVRLGPMPARPKRSPVLAFSAAERQRRRKTWKERLQWNALPEGCDVEMRWLCDDAVRSLLAQVIAGLPAFAKAA